MITILILLLLVLLISAGLPYDNYNIIRLWKNLSYKQKTLILCILGWAAFVLINALIATFIIQVAFGITVAHIYSFLGGVGIYIFWYHIYKKIIKKIGQFYKS